MTPTSTAHLAESMRAAAAAFLATLGDERSRATAGLDDPDYRTWTYLPGPRPGLPLLRAKACRQRLRSPY